MGDGRFKVNRMVKLTGREGIFACGDIVEGTVAVGMSVLWPLRGEMLATVAPIRAVEYLDVDLDGGGAGACEIALGPHFGNDAGEMEQLFRDCLEPGMVVSVVTPDRQNGLDAGFGGGGQPVS